MLETRIKLICKKCGKERFVSKGMLWFIENGKTTGQCRSCSLIGNKRKTLGKPYDKKFFRSAIYSSWANMKARCLNRNSPKYFRYGGRGIKICDKWLTFSGFLEDMQDTFQEGLTLERINNNGNYCKENCKWILPELQANNTSKNRKLTFNNKKLSITAWAKKLGGNNHLVANRIDKLRWPIGKALTIYANE